jgi:short-subunit dehydrogenase
MAFDPTGRRVLVTGASSGIGAATARLLASQGAVVALAARRADRLDEVLADCRATSPASQAFVVDLGDLDGVEAFAAGVTDALGGIDVLINNAGAPRRRRMTAITPAEFDETMAVNFTSVVRLTLAVLPQMLERRDGVICNVSSMGTRSAALGIGAYAAAKGALNLFTEGLWFDLTGTGVVANLFIPGTTSSEFSQPRDGNDPPFAFGGTKQTPEEVAERLVACLGTDVPESFSDDKYATLTATKYADHSAFLLRSRERLAAVQDSPR